MSGPLVSASAAFVAKNSRIPPFAIEQSLRFDGSSRLDFGSPTSQTVSALTVSCWVKVCMSNSYGATILDRYSAPNTATRAWLIYNAFGTNQFDSYYYTASINGRGLLSSQGRHRDPSAWQHVVFSFDNTAGQYSQKIFINGVDVTNNFSEATNGVVGFEFSSTYPLTIGWNSGEMYLAEYHLISGSQVNYDQFGEYDESGVWVPKEYTGSHGTNGFYLKFDPTAANGIGHDHSGTGNHLTASGFTTSGTGTDVMSDTPTNNWCVMNPNDNGTSNITLSNGNLSFAAVTTWDRGVKGTFAVSSGKWYWEYTHGTIVSSSQPGADLGITKYTSIINSHPNGGATNTDSYILAAHDGELHNGSYTGSSYGSAAATGDIISIALDLDNGKIWWAKNGTWFNSGNPTSGTNAGYTGLSGTFHPLWYWGISPGTGGVNLAPGFNFGQRDFEYTPPTGFKALNTSNLPAPDIADGSDYLSVNTYTGTGSAQTITTDFESDFIWIKRRNSALNHAWVDSERGLDKILRSNTTTSPRGQITDAQVVTSITSTGFVVGTSSLSNNSSDTYVAWAWPKSAVGGFDILTYTGTGSARTVSHSLGVKPAFIAIKEYASNGSWVCYHKELGATKAISLENYSASYTSSGNFNNTEPTDSVFTVGTAGDVNGNGAGFIAYLWSEVEGYSKFGSYVANGSSDGPFVYCGFKPAWIMRKAAVSDTSHWVILDTARDTYNETDNQLLANADNAESDASDIDILSNGFKMRSITLNGNGTTYIYAAFAENPFGGDGVNPATAR